MWCLSEGWRPECVQAASVPFLVHNTRNGSTQNGKYGGGRAGRYQADRWQAPGGAVPDHNTYCKRSKTGGGKGLRTMLTVMRRKIAMYTVTDRQVHMVYQFWWIYSSGSSIVCFSTPTLGRKFISILQGSTLARGGWYYNWWRLSGVKISQYSILSW